MCTRWPACDQPIGRGTSHSKIRPEKILIVVMKPISLPTDITYGFVPSNRECVVCFHHSSIIVGHATASLLHNRSHLSHKQQGTTIKKNLPSLRVSYRFQRQFQS